MKRALVLLILVAGVAYGQTPRNNMTTTLYMPGGSLGAMMYFNSSGFPVNLAPNITTNQQCLTETGTGVSGNAPVWVTCTSFGGPPTGPASGDLAGTYPGPSVFQAHLTDQATPTPPASGTLIFASFNQQGFSVAHIYDTQGNHIEPTRDNMMVVRNNTGSTITKGSVVYQTGATGTVPTIALAKANSSTTMPAFGVMYEDTANNAFGRMMVLGNLENFNLSSFANGDSLYVSSTTAGAFVNAAPATFPQKIGSVINNGVGNGVMLVHMDTGSRISYGSAAGGVLGGTYPNPSFANGSTGTVGSPVVLGISPTIDSPAITGQLGANLGLGTVDSITRQITNEGATGTTTKRIVKLTGAFTGIISGTGDTGGFVGICANGCGTVGQANIVITGTTPCTFDGATTANDYVQNSPTTAGECHDAGSTKPTSGQIIGRVQTTNASGGDYNVDAWVPEIAGAGGSGTVTSFSAGNLSPIFTTSVATATTTPALSFSLSNFCAHCLLINSSGSSAAPTATTLGSGDVPCAAMPALTGDVTSSAGSCSTTASAIPANADRIIGWCEVDSQNNNGTMVGVAATSCASTTGNSTLKKEAGGLYSQFATTTTLNNSAGWLSAAPNIDTDAGWLNVIVMRTGTSATDLTNVRYWWGVSAGTLSGVDAPPGNTAAIRWSTNVPDTNFQIECADSGAVAENHDTGIAPAQNTRYVIKQIYTHGTGITFYINGTNVGSCTTRLPADGTAMHLNAVMQTLNTTAKTGYVAKYYFQIPP